MKRILVVMALAICLLVLSGVALAANDSFDSAQEISVGDSVSGTLPGGGKYAYYTFTLASDTRIKIRIVHGSGVSGYGSLYGADKKRLATGFYDSTKGTPYSLTAGQYYFMVGGTTGDTGGSFQLDMPAYTYASSITISPATRSLDYQQQAELAVVTTPAGVDDEVASWRSSAPYDCVVSPVYSQPNKATVYAQNTGSYVITATMVGGATATCTVTVPTPSMSGIKLVANQISLAVGFEYAALRVTAVPNILVAPTDLVWSSSNPAVLDVDPTGRMRALATGQATLTVNSPSRGLSAKCVVTVGPNELRRSSPPSYDTGYDDEDYGAIVSCAKRMYYKGKYLYIEVFLSNQTVFKIARKSKLKLYVYDFGISEERPVYKKTISWNPGTMKPGRHKVFKMRLPKGKLLGRNLGMGQMDAMIAGKFKIRKGMSAKAAFETESVLPKRGFVPRAIRKIG